MLPSITVTRNITEVITIEQLANWFWMLDAEQKVAFFNSMAAQTEEWFGGLKYCNSELSEVVDNPALTEGAKYILKLLQQ